MSFDPSKTINIEDCALRPFEHEKAYIKCPHCGKNILDNFYTHVIGFAHAPVGFVKITECPKCFEKYYSHCSDADIDMFKYQIENNTNIHFKKD